MNRNFELRAGDVVQIDPATPECFFGGCFMMVTEPKSWGAQGFIAMPKSRTEPPGHAYFRATWEQMEYVGPAAWAPPREHDESEAPSDKSETSETSEETSC